MEQVLEHRLTHIKAETYDTTLLTRNEQCKIRLASHLVRHIQGHRLIFPPWLHG
jgi:hypothetical protein